MFPNMKNYYGSSRTVLETREIFPDGNIARYVIAVTQTVIKTVDANGYPYYYDRYSGKLKPSAQSSRIMNDRVLSGIDRIEQYIARHGDSPAVLGPYTWNSGLKPYLNSDNTINPQWRREDGSSIEIRAIKGIKIKKMKFNL